jgi:hypothetical protein
MPVHFLLNAVHNPVHFLLNPVQKPGSFFAELKIIQFLNAELIGRRRFNNDCIPFSLVGGD